MHRLFLILTTTLGIAVAPADDALPPVTDGAWTIAVIPDTQYYVRNEKDAGIFTEVTTWLAEQKEARNIRLVVHVGDIVNDNTEAQWSRARTSMGVLDGKLPYILSVGNHDLGRNASSRETMLNEHFDISQNPLNQQMLGGVFQEGELENAWYRFESNGWKAIVFSLEFGPRQEVVDWANGIAAAHPGTPLMLVTHEFLDQESTFTSEDGLPRRTTPKTTNNPHRYGIARGSTVLCGEELWDQFVSKHPSFGLVINGHYKPFEMIDGKLRHLRDLTSVHRTDRNGDGLTTQMLFNAQWTPRGGHGWLRLLEFQPDGRTVQVRTFSPHIAQLTDKPEKARRTGKLYDYTFTMPNGPVK